MSSTATAAISVLLAVAAAAGVSLSMRSASASVSPTDAAADLQRELAALRSAQAELQEQIESLRSAPVVAASTTAAPSRTAAGPSDEQVGAAVEAYLQRRAAKGAGGEAAAAVVPGFDLAKDFDGLVGKNYWGSTELWKKAFAAGRMDDVIRQFEDLAKQNPNDIQSQMNLANAYMAYLQMDQSKWQYSMKADQVFDDVLALDETHWEARFTKAVSYTFYPDFLGKKTDAIAHFETLVAQQEKMPIDPDHAQTYLYLGNLLETRDPAKAKEMWAKGARRHPDNQELKKKAGG